MTTALLNRLCLSRNDFKRRVERLWSAFESVLAHDHAWAMAICVVAALQTVLVCTHIPWLDELQALLIAQQSPDLVALLHNLRYEGHPPLWYLLLRALGQILPFAWVLPVLSIVMAGATQALILVKAPFSRGERLLLALSEFTLIEFGTISRSLALGALLVLVCTAFWRSRGAWAALALLPMCDFLFGMLSVALIALRARERLVWLPGLAAWLALSTFAAWSVIPAPDMVPAEYLMPVFNEMVDFFQRLGGLGLPFQTFLGYAAWDGYPPISIGGAIAALLLCWWWQRTGHDRIQRALLFGYVISCFLFSVLVYPLHLRHLTTIALLFIALTWLAPQNEERERNRWRLWLGAVATCGLATSIEMLSNPFDAAPQAAAMMRKLDDGRRPWLSWPANRAPALHVASGIRLVLPEQGCAATFVRWNFRSPIRDGNALYRAMSGWADRYGQSFLVLQQLPRGIPESLFLPISTSLRGYDGQEYVLGILGPNLPMRPRAYPPCIAGLRNLP